MLPLPPTTILPWRSSDTPVTINVLANDTDPLGTIDPSTVTVVTPSSGQAVANPDGTITYTPGVVLGNVTFTYTVDDNLGIAGNTATVTVFVDAPPVAINDSALAIAGKAVTISVLANDHDMTALSIQALLRSFHPVQRQRAVNNNGSHRLYAERTLGNVTFTYTVEDNLGVVSNAATVTVFVDAPPVAIDNWVMTRSDTPVTIIVLGNDQDTGGTFESDLGHDRQPAGQWPGRRTMPKAPSPTRRERRNRQQHVHLHGQRFARGRLQCGDSYGLR